MRKQALGASEYSRKALRVGETVKKQLEGSGHMTNKCQSKASQVQHEGQGLIELFPRNMDLIYTIHIFLK